MPMSVKDVYQLPNGEVTDDSEVYISQWRRVALPIEEIIQGNLIAFDPDFTFMVGKNEMDASNDTRITSTLFLPKWFVLKLNEFLKEKELPNV